jgi:hypothetical protein
MPVSSEQYTQIALGSVTSTGLLLDQRRTVKSMVNSCSTPDHTHAVGLVQSVHRPSNDFPRRRTLPSLLLFAEFSVFELASISVPPPRRPTFLTSDDQHPPPTATAKRFSVSYSSSSSGCRSTADRDRKVLARGAADAVCEVHVVPVGAVFEREPGGALRAPAGAGWAIATDVDWSVEVAFEAGGLLARVERVTG